MLGHTGLASYYTQKGETPGVWVGSGMAGIDGLDAGDPVTAEQMRFLFGSGHHPLSRQRGEALPPDATAAQARDAIRLGQPFKVYAHDMPAFRIEVAKRFAAYNARVGAPHDAPVPAQVRAAIRTQVGRETFRATFGRDPVDARELAGLIATASRPQTTAVAGYDLTFSPVKSVSTLWALAEPSTAATIERAHLAAIGDALRFIETHALYTRTGHNGVRQVDVTGLIAARFTHRDSRAGDPEALGFYLDNHRVHVGDLGTCADQVFDSWLTARQAGADALMVAPTRTLVAELNSRAQTHLRGGGQPSRTVALADGSDAAVGDVIITRLNDRRLRTSGTDWVRNGDRWTITGIATNGDLRAIHQTNRQTVILPAGYVTESVELGYACTIHGAQGVTADVLHGIATGAETRQQLYTMLTRGRYANHVHLEVVGDGDAHSLIRPEAILPPTATDLLRRILARDEDNTSATTTARTLAAPANRLADAVARYSDALGYAAEQTTGADLVQRLEQAADELVAGLPDAPAWPTLRAHLLLIAASGTDPVRALTEAVQARELGSAADPAAVLDWRLEPATGRRTQPGPLPWLPGLPTSLGLHRDWGDYLQRRHQLVGDLTDRVRTDALASTQLPAWAPAGSFRPDAATVADLTVWRAAHGTPATDTRPTGERQYAAVEARWQARLDRRIIDHLAPAVAEWTPLLHQVAPAADRDPYLPVLAHRLAQVAGVGLDANRLLHAAASEGQLPDDHAASALWWRICRHLTPTVANQLADRHNSLTTNWLATLEQATGPERAATIQASPWWPALVVTMEQALARGWQFTDLLSTPPTSTDVDDCQALVWRTSILLDPLPDTDDLPPDPADNPRDEHWAADVAPLPGEHVAPDADPRADEVEPNLAYTWEAIERRAMTPSEISAADLNAQLDRADAWRASPRP